MSDTMIDFQSDPIIFLLTFLLYIHSQNFDSCKGDCFVSMICKNKRPDCASSSKKNKIAYLEQKQKNNYKRKGKKTIFVFTKWALIRVSSETFLLPLLVVNHEYQTLQWPFAIVLKRSISALVTTRHTFMRATKVCNKYTNPSTVKA